MKILHVKHEVKTSLKFKLSLKFLFAGSTQLTCSVSNSALSNKYCGSYLGFNAIAQGNQLVCGKLDSPEFYFIH